MIVIADRSGQLGNRLVTFAHFVAFALEHGVAVANPGFRDYARLFPAFAEDPLCGFPHRRSIVGGRALRGLHRLASSSGGSALGRAGINSIALPGNERCNILDPAFVSLARTSRLLFVSGFMYRGFPAFARHAGRIRVEFAPSPQVLSTARRATDQARGDADLLVGVHVRRGDYAEWSHGRYFYSDEQYGSMMDRVEAGRPGSSVRFLVCSDEPSDPRAFGDRQVAPGPGRAIDDMYALAHCDLVLGPPSTFSLWAAFWGDVPIHMVEDPSAPLGPAQFLPAWHGET